MSSDSTPGCRSAHQLHEQALKLAEHAHGIGKDHALFVHTAVSVHVLVRARSVNDGDDEQAPAARRRGLLVIPIIYTARTDENVDAYRRMYEKSMIFADSVGMLGEFERLLMKLVR